MAAATRSHLHGSTMTAMEARTVANSKPMEEIMVAGKNNEAMNAKAGSKFFVDF